MTVRNDQKSANNNSKLDNENHTHTQPNLFENTQASTQLLRGSSDILGSQIIHKTQDIRNNHSNQILTDYNPHQFKKTR